VIAALLALAITLPPVGAGFDYQIGGGYPLPPGVSVVSRDWRDKPAGDYAVCYVNAFQSQPGEGWPRALVLRRFEDPGWPGEFAIDISTGAKRARAVRHVEKRLRRCAAKGFKGVEYDNLDSWTRFDGTPLADEVPFGKPAALDYARLLTDRAHALGMAVGQKNTADINRKQSRRVGFDFAIAEECSRYDECGRYRNVYGNRVIEIEYRRGDFRKACRTVGPKISVVLRDRLVSPPSSPRYVYDAC
jgi:hypothetical protein